MKQHTPKPEVIPCWLFTICAIVLIYNQAAGQENI